MKKIGEKTVTIKKADFLSRTKPDLSFEFARENTFVDVDVVNILAVRIKLTFTNVKHDRPEIHLGTYFIGNFAQEIGMYGQVDIVRYLDPSTCEIIFNQVPRSNKAMFIDTVAFFCNEADFNMHVEVFDISKEEIEGNDKVFLTDKGN